MPRNSTRARQGLHNPAPGVRSILASEITWCEPESLKRFPGNPRRHPEVQIRALMRNIARQGWTNPILTDESGTILAGHGRLDAAMRLALPKVPTLTLYLPRRNARSSSRTISCLNKRSGISIC